MKRTKNLILSEIAEAAGLSSGAFYNIVNGKRRPSWPMSQRLEAATGISAVCWIDGIVTREYLQAKYNLNTSARKRHAIRKYAGRKERLIATEY